MTYHLRRLLRLVTRLPARWGGLFAAAIAFVFLGIAIMPQSAIGAATDLSKILEVQREIESAIKAIVGSQLAEGEYFVYAKVKLRANSDVVATGQSDKLNELINLPYSPLKVEREVLKDMLRRNKGETTEVSDLDVTIVFDIRVPKEKVELLSGVISERFGFNGQNRRLDVKSLRLVTEPLQQAERLILERTKFDSDKAMLELEQARSKFELAKREAELDLAKKTLESRAAEASPVPGVPGATSATNSQGEKEKGPLEYLQGFQVLLLAVIGGLFAIVIIFLAASSLQKGLRPMADAVNRIGEGFGKMAPSSSPVAAGSVAGGPIANIGMTTSSATASARSASSDGVEHGGFAGSIRSDRGPEDKGLEEFLAQITDKLKVLMEEKNFSFYRHFIDMVESDGYRKMAAAILLTIDEKDARSLLANLSTEHIDRLKDYLTKPGSMLEARSVSKVALQEFYGRIAAEEFSGSPLYKLSNLSWFTQMTTANMADFVVSLEPELRSAFLACLTPARVNALISSSKEKEKREEIIKSLKSLDQVTEAQIEAAMQKIGQQAAGNKAESSESKPMINSAKYIAQVAENLSAEDRAVLMTDLEQNKDLSKKLRDHVIPFSTVMVLPKEMLNEIFSGRSDLQIAQIIFDTAQEIRAKVMGILPEIRRENVKSELQVLDDNKLYSKRNRKMSAELQKEITKYLLNLYREGLIELDEDALQQMASESEQADETNATRKNVA